MKKTLKSIILTIIAVFTFASSGCFEKTQEYTNYGMTITMDKGFEEDTNPNYTWYLAKNDAIMLALKEPFSGDFNPENVDLDRYTQGVQIINNNDTIIYNRENDDYNYYTYTKTIENETYFYLVTTHQSSDAYWLIQFACLNSKKGDFEEKFLTWADSITFADTIVQE